jgi:hypothetical protein
MGIVLNGADQKALSINRHFVLRPNYNSKTLLFILRAAEDAAGHPDASISSIRWQAARCAELPAPGAGRKAGTSFRQRSMA